MSRGVATPLIPNSRNAPKHYVAGVGRGAHGFTTRSDIGPARQAAPEKSGSTFGQKPPQPPQNYVAGAGRGLGGRKPERDATGKEQDYSATNYDSFGGYGTSLFGDSPYDLDDKEADEIYASVDARLELRRKRQREESQRAAAKKARRERPRIGDQFADLKQGLSKVSAQEWAALPDSADLSARHLRAKQRAQAKGQWYSAVPDSVVNANRQANSTVTTLDKRQQMLGGFATPASTGAVTDFRGLSEARDKVLGIKLDKISDSVSGQTVVDPKGYLTDLSSIKVETEAEIGDYKKAELLLKKLIETNPKHGPGWIALARLHKTARKLVQARKVIRQGCEACPKSEDVWLEAARLATPTNAAIILANAVRHLPNSVKVWMHAASLEEDSDARKRVLRRALKFVPNSVRLWKAAIELEEEDDARIMLAQAVECVPNSVELWLALARLEDYKGARSVLNKARRKNPTEPKIWISAAQLEEAQSKADGVPRAEAERHAGLVDTIIQKAVVSLESEGAHVDREAWLKAAEDAENADAPVTCAAIIRHTIGLGVEDEDRRRTWTSDAESFQKRGAVACARACYAHTLRIFPKKRALWRASALLEKEHGTPEALDNVLREAVNQCPHAEVLWLMAAKEKWVQGHVDRARTILAEAFEANPDSEAIWLAAVKLEWENDQPDRARVLLQRARERAPSARVWMKSALLEREFGAFAAVDKLLAEGVAAFPAFPKLWLMMAQEAEARKQDVSAARTAYQRGLRHNPTSVPLWINAARLEERAGSVTKARTVLELARQKCPKTAELWVEAIRLERRGGQPKQAELLMARAKQECPKAGTLWAEEIRTASRADRRRTTLDALRAVDDDPVVLVEVAHLFQSQRKYEKARKWFNRAVTLNPDLGDAWAAFYCFELERGTAEQQAALLKKFEAAEPHHGELWCAITKAPAHRRKKPLEHLKLVVAASAASFQPGDPKAVIPGGSSSATTTTTSSSTSTTVAAGGGAGGGAGAGAGAGAQQQFANGSH